MKFQSLKIKNEFLSLRGNNTNRQFPTNRKFCKKYIYLQNNLYKFFVWRIQRKAINRTSQIPTNDFSDLIFKHYNVKMCYSTYSSKMQMKYPNKLEQDNILLQNNLIAKTIFKKLDTLDSRNFVKHKSCSSSQIFRKNNRNKFEKINRQNVKTRFLESTKPTNDVLLDSNSFSKTTNLKLRSFISRSFNKQHRNTNYLGFFSNFAKFIIFYKKKSTSNLTPGNFFPHKKSFLCYWVLPFIGFVALTYSKQNNTSQFNNSFQLWPFLTSNSSYLTPSNFSINPLRQSQTESFQNQKTSHFLSKIHFNDYTKFLELTQKQKFLENFDLNNSYNPLKENANNSLTKMYTGTLFETTNENLQELNVSELNLNNANISTQVLSFSERNKVKTNTENTEHIRTLFLSDSLIQQKQNNQAILVYEDNNFLKEYSTFLNFEKNQLKNISYLYLYKMKNWLYEHQTKTDFLHTNKLNLPNFSSNNVLDTNLAKQVHSEIGINNFQQPLFENSLISETYNFRNKMDLKWFWHILKPNSSSSFNFDVSQLINSKLEIEQEIKIIHEKSDICHLNLDEFPKKINFLNTPDFMNKELSDQNVNLIDGKFSKESSVFQKVSETTKKQPILDYNKACVLLDNYIKEFKFQHAHSLKDLNLDTNIFWTSEDINNLKTKIQKAKKVKFNYFQSENKTPKTSRFFTKVILLSEFGNKINPLTTKVSKTASSQNLQNLFVSQLKFNNEQKLITHLIGQKLEKLFLVKSVNKTVIKMVSKDNSIQNKSFHFVKNQHNVKFFKKDIFELGILKKKRNGKLNSLNSLPINIVKSTIIKQLLVPKTIVNSLETSFLKQVSETQHFRTNVPKNFYKKTYPFLQNGTKRSPKMLELLLSKTMIKLNQPILMSGYDFPELNLKNILIWRNQFPTNFLSLLTNNKNLKYGTINTYSSNLEESFKTIKSLENSVVTFTSNENHLTNKKVFLQNENNFINKNLNDILTKTHFEKLQPILQYQQLIYQNNLSKIAVQEIVTKYLNCIWKKLSASLNSEKLELLQKHNSINYSSDIGYLVPKTNSVKTNTIQNKLSNADIQLDNSKKLDVLGLPSIKKFSPLRISKIHHNSKNIKKELATSILDTQHFKAKAHYPIKKSAKRKIEKILRTYLSNKYSEKNEIKNLSNKINLFESNQTNLETLVSKEVESPKLLRNHKNSSSDFQSKKKLIKLVLSNLKHRRTTSQINRKIYINLFKKSTNKCFVKNLNEMSLDNSKYLMNFSFETSSFWKKKVRSKLLKQKTEGNIKIPLSSNSLLKRVGFLFLNQTDRQSLENKNQKTLIRFEKQKSQQKKRRRKKLKLENRRRKKRKRFYPRPKWIRVQLAKNFNKIRHKNKRLKNSVLKSNRLENYRFLKNSVHFKVLEYLRASSKYRYSDIPEIISFKAKAQLKHPNYLSNFSSKTTYSWNNSPNCIQKDTNQQSGLNATVKEKNGLLRQKIYRNNKHKWSYYSLETSNFEKLTIKKQKANKLLPIFANHSFYQISNTLMSDFQRLCWKSYWMRSNLNPYIERIKNYLNKVDRSQRYLESQTSFKYYIYTLFGLSMSSNYNNLALPQFFWTQRNDNSRSTVEKVFIPQKWGSFNIKNCLESTNFVSNSSFFFNSRNVAEYNRIQLDRISDIIKNVKNNLNVNGQNRSRSYKKGRQKTALVIQNNYWTRLAQSLDPQIRAFSPFTHFIGPSIKAYGDLPTLRALWALNKTNLLNFKEQNQTKNLWIALKNREQKKSNKTKKFLYKIYKKIASFRLISKEVSTKDIIITSFQKAKHTENKIRYLGFHTKHYENYLRNLKIKLKQPSFIKDFKHLKTISTKNFEKIISSRNPILKKSAKRSTQFWWSTKEINFQSFLYTSNFRLNDFSFVQSQNVNNLLTPALFSGMNFSSEKTSLWAISRFIETSLWACTVLFHICALFSLIRISEIRSLFKFHLLVFCKVSNSYLFLVYSIFNSLKSYKQQIFSLKNYAKNWFLKIKPKTKKSRLEYLNGKQNFFLNTNSVRSKVLDAHSPKNPILDTSVSKKAGSDIPLNNLISETNRFRTNVLKTRSAQNSIQRFLFLQSNLHRYKKTINSSPKNIKTTIDSLFYSCIKILRTLTPFFNSTFTYMPVGLKSENNFSKLLLNKNKRIKTFTSLFIFSIVKFSINFFNGCLNLFYSIVLKFLDILESFMVIIYKFLEKPAELMIEWIAQIFLLEWSSDLYTYAPESLDIYTWNSFYKLSRNLRSLSIDNLFVGGFLLQRRVWCFMELFLDYIMKPDSDLLTRQKKGLIFWEIWAEILIQAAEQYNVNIPSLTTLKEEQELLIERLLEDDNWNWCQPSMYQMAPLISLVKNSKPIIQDKNIEIVKYNSEMTEFWNSRSNPLNISKLLNSAIQSNNFYDDINNKVSVRENHIFFDNNTNESQLNVVTLANSNFDKWKRWSANQYFTYQGRDTDLFIDIHPPKSFQHMSTIKYYEPAQQPMGTLVCQIYSGIFSKQVSKNILVVGAGGVGKTLLIQALAGETELKIMTDNAHRYGIVQRGVAVGMKLLRDVFEAIALHTPCLFLMEDIHVIGERRPMLISDDENAKAADLSFGSSADEVHEKNQVIYQLSKHAVSHYKKAYKGDFSLLIPTNHFCFDLFLGVSPPKTRSVGITPEHPLPVNSIQKDLEQQNNANVEFSNNASENSSPILVSSLQLPSEKLFAPPATSPFTILMMKEQKKIKPRKIVKEIPWSGLSSDQMLLLPKVTYSVRVKVAMLADIAISNLSVKLDMITDLLVIIDSVRSNRGFVVFATTHAPYMLDPALRRPGRLDETISLPLLPNLLNRFEILKTNLLYFSSTLDFVDAAIMTESFNETQISNMISKSKLLLLNISSKQIASSSYLSKQFNLLNHNLSNDFINLSRPEIGLNNYIPELTNFTNNKINKSNMELNTLFSLAINNINQASHLIFNDLVEFSFYSNKKKINFNNNLFNNRQKDAKINEQSFLENGSFLNEFNFRNRNSDPNMCLDNYIEYDNNVRYLKTSNVLAGTYFRISKFLINSKILGDQTSYGLILWNNLPDLESAEESLFTDLYSPSYNLRNHLIKLLSGKIGEFFVFNNYRATCNLEKRFSNKLTVKLQTIDSRTSVENLSINFPPTLGPKLWNLSGMDKFWRSATAFVFSLIHKRYLYSKNLLISRLFYFQDISTLKEPPSPPSSSILNPSKNYENFKRTMADSQQRAIFSINEKIQLHQQQRLIKKLYNKPIKEFFRSELIQNRQTFFSSSFKELGYLDNFTTRPTSVNCYYRNRILTRHKYYFTNQWWNGQLAEHNAETTFLSDVDWRSMFVNSLGDLVIDFPDADQHYNPRKRRWMLNSGYWGYWLNFEKTFQSEIYYHYIMECFNLATNSLDNQREIIDYFAYLFLRKGVLKEMDLITTLSRFK